MHKKDFFEVLKNDLPNDAYKDRLIRELENHWEDSKRPEHDLEKDLGDPSDFINFYNLIMKRNIPLYLETLFIGICSITLSLLTAVSSSFTVVAIQQPGEQWEHILPWLIFLPFLGFIFTIFYNWVWAYLKSSFPEQKLNSKKLLILLLAPTWYYLGTLGVLIFLDNEAQHVLTPIMFGVFLSIQAVSAWKSQEKMSEKKRSKLPEWLGPITLFVILGAILVLWGGSPSDLIKVPFSWLYVVTLVPFSDHFIFGQYLVACLFALLMSYCLVKVGYGLKNKEPFKWGKAFFGAFLLYAFTFQGGHEDESIINWARPTVEISRTWEERELGILSNWYNFVSGEGDFAFSYAIKWTSNGLQLTNQADQIATLKNLSEDPTALNWTYSEEKAAFTNSYYEKEAFLPEAFHCVTDFELPSAPSLGGDTSCRQLYFEDQIIYNSPISVRFDNVVVSPDKEWMAIHFPWQSTVGNIQIPDRVVLIHLTGAVYFEGDMFFK